MKKFRIWYRAKNGLYTRAITIEAETRSMALLKFNKVKPLKRYLLNDLYELINDNS